jgi:hypothetical protein
MPTTSSTQAAISDWEQWERSPGPWRDAKRRDARLGQCSGITPERGHILQGAGASSGDPLSCCCLRSRSCR